MSTSVEQGTSPAITSERPSRPTTRKRPIDVVHLLHTVAYGGIETILINWLTTLDPERVRAHIVVFENPGNTEDAFVEIAEKAGLRVRKVSWSRWKPVRRAARELGKILDEIGAEIVHTHNVYAEIVGYVATRDRDCKVMNTLYVIADFGFKRNVQQWVSMRLIRRFDLVTSQCAATMREATCRGVPSKIQKVLISGVRPSETTVGEDERSRRRADRGVGPDDLVLVNVARLYPEKAQDLLLRAFRRIHDERPNTELWIMGVGPLEDELRALCTELGLDDAVTFLGFAEELQGVLALCDIQVHPSHAEGVPLSICEGMRAGLPIVSSAVGGIPEMISHERNGLLFDPGDAEAFVRETLGMIDDEPRRRRLEAEARRFIETKYSLATAVDQLATTYEELLAG